MAKRKVKTIDAALASTSRPVRAGDGLENVVAGLGTDRDKRSYTNWTLPVTLTRQDLENMYSGSWLAKRIINTVADDMTREWLHFFLDEKHAKDTQAKIDKAEKKFGVRAKVNEALRWARLYGGSVIIIGTKDSKDLSKPLDITKVKKGDLRYMHVLDRWRVSGTGVLNKDLTSPNFGLPDSYIIAESAIEVHHTRVLRFNGQKLPYFMWLRNAMWDHSELQHVRDSLMNADTASQALATMLFEANVDVVKSDGLSEQLAIKGGETAITKRFQLAALMKSFNRTLLLDGTESYEKKSNTFANLDKVWTNFMVDVCGAADIPMTRLFGQAPGGLNSTGEGDLRNYYDMISSKQEAEMRSQLEYLYEILLRSELGDMPEDFGLDFNPLWQMSEKEMADVEKVRSERDKNYLDMGVVTEGLIASELKERGTYRTMTADDVTMAEELAEMSQEARELGHEGMKKGLEEGGEHEEPDGDEGPNPTKKPDNDGDEVAQ